ncbi:LTA synthase family protein [Paenibacillus sp. J5C_2022]|uniref:LTA synthase family protein n=1 Tax=Paenibacillus sp. J5C2022 TaxID=2977129 RepID=UPI0021CF0DB1|nr:LTA synthase family protein [Paenibacillus sp. J5C2022]MCU6707728.1 LTA synthase family protein [Paenibacillus sp. J5C2022]
MLKMVLFRYFIFEGVQFDRLLADAAAVLAVLCLFELTTTSRWKSAVFIAVNAIVSLMLFSSAVYFSYFSSVPTYKALLNLGQVGQVSDSVEASMELKFFLFFLDFAVLALLKLVTLKANRKVSVSSKAVAKPYIVMIALIISLGASLLYIRMDRHISNELVQAERLGFLNYQVATAIKEKKASNALADSSIKEMEKAVAAHLDSYDDGAVAGTPNYFGVAEGKNVIVVQLEAFQNMMINLEVDGQAVTPVMNELIGDSFYFPHFFQQVGQGNTSDAEFLSNTSIYPTGAVAMSKGFGDRDLPSLPKLLDKDNYSSLTFHVNDVTFWERDKLYPALGFTKYYERADFNNDKFNAFGASDKEMYRVGLKELTKLHEQDKPFYAQFISTSSHHPFKVPKDLQTMTLRDSLEGTQLGNYIQASRYTDQELGRFIEGLKANGMWDNTVLLIYGDHFGLQTKDNDPAWVEEQLGMKYEERMSRFNIPFIVHVPGVEGKTLQTVGGQVDIMPTIANLLGVSLEEEGFTAFGKDLLNVTNNAIGMRYYMPTGSFFNNDIMFVPGESFEDGTAYDLNTMEPVEEFSQYRDDYDYVLKLMKLSDEYVKLLPKR